jgi:hypothetical protein
MVRDPESSDWESLSRAVVSDFFCCTSTQGTPMSIDRLESQLQVHKRSGSAGERVPVLIFDDPGEIALQAARRIRTLIQEKDAANEYAVLGLPTGSTPIGVYHELARMHREEGLDFTNVITFRESVRSH